MNTDPKTSNLSNSDNDLIGNPAEIIPSGYEEEPNHGKEKRKRRKYMLREIREWFVVFFAGGVASFTLQIMLGTGEQAKSSRRTVTIADRTMKMGNRAYMTVNTVWVDTSNGPYRNKFTDLYA